MAERLPSVEIVAARLERLLDGRARDFDSLDTKAGVVLGFAGVLIALANRRQSLIAVLGLVFAGTAGIAAVAAFAVRRHPDLDAQRLSGYIDAERDFTLKHLVDAQVLMVERSLWVLEIKDRRLRVAILTLVAAILLLGIDALVR